MAARRGRQVPLSDNGLRRPTPEVTGVENIGKNAGLTNRPLPPRERENPGALAGATGAETDTPKSAETFSQKSRRDAIFTLAQARHRAAVAAITAALTLGEDGAHAWARTHFVLRARLTRFERAALTLAAMRSLDGEDRREVFSLARGDELSAGAPLPPFLNVMDDARFWASLASTRELKAYALAAFEALRPADRARFLAHVTGRASAGRAA